MPRYDSQNKSLVILNLVFTGDLKLSFIVVYGAKLQSNPVNTDTKSRDHGNCVYYEVVCIKRVSVKWGWTVRMMPVMQI